MNWLSMLALVAAVSLSLTTWLRRGRRFRIAVVETLRVGVVLFVVWLLNQPETVYIESPSQKRAVVLVRDDSLSMKTADAVLGTRADSAMSVIQSSAWGGLDSRFKKSVVVFGDRSESDLAAAIDAAFKTEKLAAMVVLSDGDWNRGASPIDVTANLISGSRDAVAFFSIPVGSAERLPDVGLVSVDVPSYGVIGKSIRVPYTVQNWMPRTVELPVTLRVDDVEVRNETIQLRAGQRFDGVMLFEPDSVGNHSISVEIGATDGERIEENNRQSRTIEVRHEQLRVLIIESKPRWEYRYLRNALRRDPGIEVSCLLFHPGLERLGGGADYLEVFPETADALASYDVVFVGDVGTNQLDAESCRRLRGLVTQQASGLILMPGMRDQQSSLLSTELAELYPVELDVSRPRGVGSAEASRISLTAAGRQSLLTELDDDPDRNWQIWESLPGFHWHAAVERAKAGSQTLGVHPVSSNRYGRIPLLVTRPAGAGKVLFMGTDSAWRWRLGVEDKYHYRFWGQVIRWMAYQRNMAVGERIRLSYRPERPDPGETVTFRATVMNEDGSPVRASSLDLALADAEGSDRVVRLIATGSEWGVFAGETQLTSSGEHRLVLEHPTDGSSVATRLTVQGRALEVVGAPARPDVLTAIASVGGGDVYSEEQVEQLVDQINSLPPPNSQQRRIQWWNHPGVMAMILVTLGVFWVARKWAGEV
ncbi:MAG: hypothetical protein AAFX06_23290 [Planctomycetota bacterium]